MFERLKDYKHYIAIGALIISSIAFYFIWSFSPDQSIEEKAAWERTEIANEEMEESLSEEEEESKEILVDVKGAVKNPGVYKGLEEDRVMDMIEKAGGLTEEANSKGVNFAMKVSDEMVLYVPRIGEEEMDIPALLDAGSTNGKININKATKAELETLPGIGPAKAEAIIEYRETRGPFQSIEDIMSISGFGEKTFEKLQESISIK